MTRKAAIMPHDHCICVASLEHDLRDLKRRLASVNSDERIITKRPKHNGDDWIDGLAPQDRLFFERRLGKQR
jgi:hypothetical protein